MFLCPAGVGGPAAHNYVGVQCPCGMSWLPVEKKKRVEWIAAAASPLACHNSHINVVH